MALSETTLNLIPTAALSILSNALTSKATIEAAELSAEQARSNRLQGKTEVATSDGGRSKATLENSLETLKQAASIAGGIVSVGAIAQTLSDGNQQAYNPASLPIGTTGSADEIATMNTELEETMGPSSPSEFINESVELQKAEQLSKVAISRQKYDSTKSSLSSVNEVVARRAKGELPNPQINYDRMGSAVEDIISEFEALGTFTPEQIQALRDTMEKASNKNMDRFENFVIDAVVRPFRDNEAALAIIAAQLEDLPEEEDVPIFDTVFGPPVSYTGKYILSEDGIYYDSRQGGIPYITAKTIDAASWELRYASNRGGKGELYAFDQIDRFADTIFDDEYKNDSGAVKDFWKYDDVLQALQNDKDFQIMDVSAKISDLIASGYAEDSAIIKNYKEAYAGVAYTYDRKINKRKKQLQIAALFGPFGVTVAGDPAGEGMFYELVSPPGREIIDHICGSKANPITLDYANAGARGMFGIGDISGHSTEGPLLDRNFIVRVPLNNFSYLKDIGLIPNLAYQKTAMLHSSDLDDTTAPIPPTFLTQGPGSPFEVIPEMSMAPMGMAGWVNTSGDTGGVDNVSGLSGIAYIRGLDDDIVTDNLVVCYNFLEPSAVVTPSSKKFLCANYATNTGNALDAKLVGISASSIFVSGVSIPYLTGSLYTPGRKYGRRYSYLDASSGSYVRLPNNYRSDIPYIPSQPIDNLMYNAKGWSMDFWAHCPGLSSTLDYSHRYKLVAANENCGDPFVRDHMIPSARITNANVFSEARTNREGRTQGMVIGWRDRGNPGSAGASGLEFVVLPTVAQNNDRWGKSVCIGESVSGDGAGNLCVTELGFKIDLNSSTVSGYTIGEASSTFAHYSITCDLPKDTITLYVNGQFLASSLVSTSFDTKPGLPLNMPSKITEDCFQDEHGRHGEKLYSGDLPRVPIFTPWILGGGFTDGMEHEDPSLFDTTFPGFLGTNTNITYFGEAAAGPNGGPYGQHTGATVPGLGGYTPVGVDYALPRSGLEGHLGSFKMYEAPLTKGDVKINYNAQSPYFGGIKLPFRLI